LPAGKKLLVSIKGVVPGNGEIPSVFLAQKLGTNPRDCLVLGGPCHAEEIAMGRKTYLTVSGHDQLVVGEVADAIISPYLKVIRNQDPMGVELAAIMKNVVGIAAGIVRGMNYGDNFLAVVISNALRETRTLVNTLHPASRDMNDSAYFGDLLVTAYSGFSRNGAFGQLIGRGYSVHMAQTNMQMVAEGYPAARGLYMLANAAKLQLPLLSAVYRILYKQSSPFNEIRLLEHYLR
jgi:glycerol-3-phosphate dehydrogenase (NAD(P)+)